MSLRRPLRGAWWRPESRSRSTLPKVYIGGVYISKFRNVHPSEHTWRELSTGESTDIPVDLYVPHLRTTCGKVTTFIHVFKQGRSRPSFLVQTQRPSARMDLLQFLRSRDDVDAPEPLKEAIKT